jgi:predicted RNase H-like HicB family nuclease
MEYAVILESADDGSLSVWVPDLPGCVSTGDSREEALANIAEAIRGHVETLRSLGQSVPVPRSSAGVVRAA